MALNDIVATFKRTDLLALVNARIARAVATMEALDKQLAAIPEHEMFTPSAAVVRDAHAKARSVTEHKFWIPILANCTDETVTITQADLQWLRIDALDVKLTLGGG